MYADNPTRLQHILDYANEVVAFAQSHARADMDTNRMLYHSVKSCLETIGEAAYKITRDYQDAHSEVDWKSLMRMRNELIHDYFALDVDDMWVAATSEIPLVIPQIEKLLSEYPRL